MPLTKVLSDNLNILRKYSCEFREIFKVELWKFWLDNIVGFDIVAFDKFLRDTGCYSQLPDSYSMKEAIEKKYGQRAVQVILRVSGARNQVSAMQRDLPNIKSQKDRGEDK